LAASARDSASDHRLVAFGLGELDQADICVDGVAQPADRGESAFQPRPLAHHRLRLLGIVPQRRIFGARVQLVETDDRTVVVKDAS
jgi:hypothetical protein